MSQSKYDNTYKQKVLLNGIVKQVADVKRATYKKINRTYYIDNDGIVAAFNDVSSYEEMIKKYRPFYNQIDCADRLIESRQRKSSKVRKKITNLVLSNKALFITLTFNDKTFAKTDVLRRRRLVQRYLKQNCCNYVANVDYGKTNGREHYHAVVDKTIDLTKWHKYGIIDVEHVRVNEDSPKRISRYITKLTNHALKVGAIAPRLIYSRNTL